MRLHAVVFEEGEVTRGQEQVTVVDGQIAEVDQRLGRLYEALETGKVSLDDLSGRIRELRQRRELL